MAKTKRVTGVINPINPISRHFTLLITGRGPPSIYHKSLISITIRKKNTVSFPPNFAAGRARDFSGTSVDVGIPPCESGSGKSYGEGSLNKFKQDTWMCLFVRCLKKSPTWWFNDLMVMYHGALRKNWPETNPRTFAKICSSIWIKS